MPLKEVPSVLEMPGRLQRRGVSETGPLTCAEMGQGDMGQRGGRHLRQRQGSVGQQCWAQGQSHEPKQGCRRRRGENHRHLFIL